MALVLEWMDEQNLISLLVWLNWCPDEKTFRECTLCKWHGFTQVLNRNIFLDSYLKDTLYKYLLADCLSFFFFTKFDQFFDNKWEECTEAYPMQGPLITVWLYTI